MENGELLLIMVLMCWMLMLFAGSLDMTLDVRIHVYKLHMSNVQCSGTESRLIDCPHSSGDGGSGGLWSDATL